MSNISNSPQSPELSIFRDKTSIDIALKNENGYAPTLTEEEMDIFKNAMEEGTPAQVLEEDNVMGGRRRRRTHKKRITRKKINRRRRTHKRRR